MNKPKFKHSGFDYTSDQEQALDKMINWSYNIITMFTLSGAAGTGKTTVLKEFIKQNKFKSGVAVTAPTHKAVRIVSQMTNLNGITIQKLLGLRPNMNVEDFDINNPRFDPKAERKIKNFDLVIIDEASMINKGLFELILKEANTFKTKILFIGDPYQLPPVNEKISPVFTNVNDKYELTTIVRQSDDNPLLKLLDVVRNDVKKGTFNFIKLISKVPSNFNIDKKGYSVPNKSVFQKYMIAAFSSDIYSKNIDFCKFSAYTNENVLAWNIFIRKAMTEKDTSDIIVKDDLITAYSTILDEFQSPVIINSEDYILDDIQNYKNQSNIEGFVVRFRKVFGGGYTPYMFIVNTNDYQNVLRFLAIANNLIKEAYNAPASQRSRLWERYYKFKDNHLLISSLFDDMGKLIIKKDLDYGYCLTTHKTQGSTYNHIFVNAKNIIYGKNGRPYSDYNTRNKLLYVAISRATDTATILI